MGAGWPIVVEGDGSVACEAWDVWCEDEKLQFGRVGVGVLAVVVCLVDVAQVLC